MSPEQVRSTRTVDARTDVWSLGDVFAKIREEPLPSIRTIVPTVPASVDAVIARCLERERVRRFADAAELADALRAIPLDGIVDEPTPAPGEPFRARVSQSTTAFDLLPLAEPGASTAQSTAKPSSSTHAPWISVRTSSKRGRVTLAALIGGGCVAALIATALMVHGSDGTPKPTTGGPVADDGRRRVQAEPVLNVDKVEPAVTPQPPTSAIAPAPSARAPIARPVVPLVARPSPSVRPSASPAKPPAHPVQNPGDDLGI